MSKSIRLILITLALFTGLAGCSSGESISKYDTTVIGTFSDTSISVELHYSDDTSTIYIVEDGKIIENKRVTTNPKDGTDIVESAKENWIALGLDDMATIEPRDIHSNTAIINDTSWESTLKESTAYIKYLTEKGYSIDATGTSVNYIEIYLSSSGIQTQKRILITANSLTEATLPERYTATYRDYIKY